MGSLEWRLLHGPGMEPWVLLNGTSHPTQFCLPNCPPSSQNRLCSIWVPAASQPESSSADVGVGVGAPTSALCPRQDCAQRQPKNSVLYNTLIVVKNALFFFSVCNSFCYCKWLDPETLAIWLQIAQWFVCRSQLTFSPPQRVTFGTRILEKRRLLLLTEMEVNHLKQVLSLCLPLSSLQTVKREHSLFQAPHGEASPLKSPVHGAFQPTKHLCLVTHTRLASAHGDNCRVLIFNVHHCNTSEETPQSGNITRFWLKLSIVNKLRLGLPTLLTHGLTTHNRSISEFILGELKTNCLPRLHGKVPLGGGILRSRRNSFLASHVPMTNLFLLPSSCFCPTRFPWCIY